MSDTAADTRAVSFRVRQEFDAPARVVWDELIDWEAHGAWVPMTHTDVHDDDGTAVGARFTAYTGVGRLALEDRMEVVECTWDEETGSGRCVVDKHGPVLFGQAGFDVTSTSTGSVLDWFEDVDVKRMPKFLAPVAAKIGSLGFGQGMKRLAELLEQRDG
jgi:hypothetical protein